MNVIRQPSQFRKMPGPIILASGFFDGVHRGHRLVLESSVERAREIGGQAWVLTFDRHPLSVLSPSKCPPLLCALEERLRLLEEAGVDGVLLLEFTRKLAVQEPETFVRWICGRPRGEGADPARHSPNAKLSEIRCGENWRFGKRAAGTPELLALFGRTYGFRVVVVPYAEYQGVEISSTRIRYAIREGRLEDAAEMLGRPYSVRGVVVRGRGVGHALGVATANVQPRSEVMPPSGVYAVKGVVDGAVYNGVADLGVHPTFGEGRTDSAVLETHLLNFSGDLYGKTLDVRFLGRLRSERAFTSTEALVAQIQEDVRQAARYF